ncbi:MAG: DUF3071 domain-containing protein [Actinobacteria bacterium]|nr:DUF3071 domain-containing protein [Actinomycetota bacterium]
MTELRLVGKTADGDHIEFTDGQGNNFLVRLSDSLRAAVNERRLTPVPVEAPSVSLKEIQARLRAGESFAEVSRISGLSVEKIERYASPIIQERAWIIEQAEKSSPKGTSLTVRTDPMNRDEGPEEREIPTDAKKDGVTRRISIPSWDDIMFGRSKKKNDEDESNS